MNYDVAVMNYPLFNKKKGGGAELLVPPFQYDPGNGWPVSLYIHIPFCDTLCDFCVYNRVSTVNNRKLADDFVKALLSEIRMYSNSKYFRGKEIDSVFIGGGTPTSLSAAQLDMIFKELNQCFDLNESEITVECNPLNAGKDKLTVLKSRGVTRISAGIQSFYNRLRKECNIPVSGSEAGRWLEELKEYRFKDISVDLLYGFPGVDSNIFLQDIKNAVELDMGHISVYKLNIFAYTALYKKLIKQNKETYCNEESLYAMFSDSHRFLLKNGYVLQSTQEYGKAGKQVRFWDATYDGFGDNLSMGVSSFGYLNGYCYQNEADVHAYIHKANEGYLPVQRMSPRITAQQLRERALVMGFRRGYVLKKDFEYAFNKPIEYYFQEALLRLIGNGLVREKNDRYELTEKGIFYQGNVSAELMISVFRGVSGLKKKMCIGIHEMP